MSSLLGYPRWLPKPNIVVALLFIHIHRAGGGITNILSFWMSSQSLHVSYRPAALLMVTTVCHVYFFEL